MSEEERRLKEAVARTPEDAEAHSALAAHYFAAGSLDAAVEAYALARDAAPDVPHGHYNLAAVLHEQGQSEEAMEVLGEAALALPGSALLHYGQACMLQALGRNDEALGKFMAALEIEPGDANAWYGAGTALHRLDDMLRADHCFSMALECDPDHASAQYMRDAMGGGHKRGPAELFVRELFDNYSEHYDAHMLRTLDYQGHELVRDSVLRILPEMQEARVLDLGCGTGLAGSLLRDRAAELVGVDVSAKMLRRARALDCYDTLVCSNIADYLIEEEVDVFDLVIAVDVFIYIGALDELFQRIAKVLGPGGLFAFTIEEMQDVDWEVAPSGRVRHALSYLESLRRGLGFESMVVKRHRLRNEAREPCWGYVLAWRK